MKINRQTSIALAAFALALVSSLLLGQTSYSQDPQDNSKIKVKDDRVIVRDKSKPVRRTFWLALMTCAAASERIR